MTKSPYQIAEENVKQLRAFQDLRSQGLARPAEESAAFALAKETALSFNTEILRRKAEKLAAVTIWTNETHDGFLSPNERREINAWIDLIEEYLDGRKIKTELGTDINHIKSVVDGEDQHIFITEKGSDQHAHLIVDGGTGEVRIDPKDQAPHELIESVETVLKLRNGESVNVTRTSMNFGGTDIRTDVRVYPSGKDGYSSIEVYNSGQEDLEQFQILIKWLQVEGEQERLVDHFFEEHQSIMHDRPAKLNMLRVGARVYGQVPGISLDGVLHVYVSCKGMQTGVKFERHYPLEVNAVNQ